jgi:hypothetical protein
MRTLDTVNTRRCWLLTCLSALLVACGGGGGAAVATPTPGGTGTGIGTGTGTGTTPAPLPPGWVRLADLPEGLAKFGVAAVDGQIHVVGGYDTRRSSYGYDIASNRWAAGVPLPRGSDNLAAVAAGGRVLAIGGEAGTALQVLDPAARTWAAGPSLPGVRFASAAARVGARVHVVGGWNADNNASASLDSQAVFDLDRQAWGTGPALSTARNAAGAAVIDDRLYVVGGRSPGIRASDQRSLGSMEVLVPGAAAWAAAPSMPTPRAGLAVVALGGQLYALGGETTPGGVSDAVERFDPASGQWTTLPAMPLRSHGLGAVVVGDSIYVLGGFTGPSDAVGTESAALYRYTPPVSLSVLMMGNSHTGLNELPQRLQAQLQARWPGRVVSVTVAPGWMFLDDRLADAASMALLGGQRWQAVVLQAQRYSSSGQFTYSTVEAQALVRRARAQGAVPVLFPEWPRRGVDETARIEGLHQSIAQAEPACVAPVATAFDVARSRQPGLVLHADDGNHSSPAGADLAARVLAATIAGGVSPVPAGTGGMPADVDPAVRVLLQQAADEAMRQSPARRWCPADPVL